ncbi:MAG: chromosome partitioning protein ParA [Candidatus Raymondbacteria bacterium RifOxyA12_full_50_37]|uniref:Iron-sulfur cluster carrier protein n=1 Tax=Candidatus Raymondbacteria bacterium RIFOXYD12_FULL_49_13 TaxID=1817890 RepID=A0A1F7F2G1_UNCRA|nr:MAG: chromosome partitioning protein ParA [Candidatus Raymondbacteria bacterium RifOxyA12_full_50_37]OGJ87828.1 MAG: chromosome partitioning protein ParA [Candidatus Raymondbacteria bacterium RifOxyB12_full_50_8]OGJ88682.1 MAG: chromosome partitioning protein ParA [Candidatus Raymondbacteria bacterium RIFOXYA2_FULL_49_16]OGJ95962.1 MAG: chromosome partitioning protein ParA [Candidatus Raymondbacteria bacterium RifOxyC12_full_50_8]OGK00854.1 MAG: chromosome partitioning protein ParA [Candidat
MECSKTQGCHDDVSEDDRLLQDRMSHIRHKIVVLSGKGGVGKSTVAVNIAVGLMMSGKKVGLLDVDIHGPSVPTMLGLEKERAQGADGELIPVIWENMKVMSLGFLLENQDHAVIWRGPMKMGVIKQFLKDVAWGDLDFLVVDSPPGTGDEPLSVCQLLGTVDGAVIVTTPQKVAAIDVRKSITFCRQLNVPVMGVVENMSGFACPKCGEVTQILPAGGGKHIAKDMDVPFLGAIPMDPKIAAACDSGMVFIQHLASVPTAKIMRDIIQPIIALDQQNHSIENIETSKKDMNMKIAIPLADGKLAMHFGHCEQFALVDADPVSKKILNCTNIKAPPHEPGLLPAWLAQQGATVIIAGGMGQRAQGLFTEQKIQVVVGAPAEPPETLVANYLNGSLQTGTNACDH